MKNTKAFYYLFFVVLIGICQACGSMKSDIKQWLSLHEDFIVLAEKTIADMRIDSVEAVKLNEIQVNISGEANRIREQYAGDEEKKLEALSIMRELHSETVFDRYNEALRRLYDCEGYELLQ